MVETNTNADMSHQNRFYYQFGEVRNSIKENGIISTVKKIAQRLDYKIKGLDFSTQNIYDLTRTGEYKENGTALVSSSKDFLKRLIDDLELAIGKRVEKELFIDYGSGKGSAIIHAKNMGFKSAIGIEFAKELNEIANRNIKILKLSGVESIYQDATQYRPNNNVSLIYFFNPFDAIVMEKVVKNIVELKDEFKNEV